MIRITVLYPNTDGNWFDMDYYLQKHVPLVIERLTPLGLIRVDLEEGLSGVAPGAPAPYRVIGSLTFKSQEDMQKAMATHGEELIADVANYTNIQAQMLLTRILQPAEMKSLAATAVI